MIVHSSSILCGLVAVGSAAVDAHDVVIQAPEARSKTSPQSDSPEKGPSIVVASFGVKYIPYNYMDPVGVPAVRGCIVGLAFWERFV